MKTQIVNIGNSQGVRIPKILLQQSKISGEVELEVCEEGILIRNIEKPRNNWDEAFKEMAEDDDDDLLDDDLQTEFERKKWRW